MSALAREKDQLGLFEDASMYVVNSIALRNLAKEAGYGSIKSFSKEIGIGRTSVYQKQIRVTGKVRERLIDLVRVYNNAMALFEKNEDEALAWLVAPNKSFYNLSPFMMCMAGNGKAVYEVQEELLDKVS